MNWFWMLFGLAAVSAASAQSTDYSRLQAIEAWAEIQENPSGIHLRWSPTSDALDYKIWKRSRTDWPRVATLPPGADSWIDTNVAVGQRYEYRILKNTSHPYVGQTYLFAGIRADILEDTGHVLMLVRDNLAAPLSAELDLLRSDLVREGWMVERRDIPSNATPPAVKDVILEVVRSTAGNLRSVILIGHIPVPYSGAIYPDGHTNHFGAWPADGFYGDIDGVWTDSEVNSQVAERSTNWNVPGDGKFDQSTYPSAVDLAVGRIDFFWMTCFSNKRAPRTEIDLTRQYLQKNHLFRSGRAGIAPKGMLYDGLGLRNGDGPSAVGWRNFTAFFGSKSIEQLPYNGYFNRLTVESALCSWASGGGRNDFMDGVVNSDLFAVSDVNVVFTFWFGSYLGDWNQESNLMRAALGSGKILTSLFSGNPHTLLHPMALGGTIGNSFVLTQNNRRFDEYAPDGQGLNEVHQCLLGDPTLRLRPRPPLPSFQFRDGRLTWTVPPDSNFLGIHLYRGPSTNGPFLRITQTPIIGTSYRESVPGTNVYMARPVWHETTGSGSFCNPGHGSILPDVSFASEPSQNPQLSVEKISPGKITFSIASHSLPEVVLERSDDFASWREVARFDTANDLVTFELAIDDSRIQLFRARYQSR